jgi:putative zinc finger protein
MEETFMDHTEALEMHATERYLLGELSTSENEAFEEHYFGCPDCAADLESATALIANAKAVFREELEPGRRTSGAHRRNWWSAWMDLLTGFRPRFAIAVTSLASVALGGVCLYQTLVSIPHLKEAAYAANKAYVLPSFALAGRARGDEAPISIERGTPAFSIYFDIDPQAGYTAYRCVLKDRAGSALFDVPAPAPAAGQPIALWVPARGLQPGSYDLVVNGLRGERETPGISDYPFTLQFK